MCWCAFQDPVPVGGIESQVCGSARSLNGQEQPNVCFLDPCRDPASGVCHSVYSPLILDFTVFIRPHVMFTVCALQAVAPMQIHTKVYGDFGAYSHNHNRPLGPDGKRNWAYGLMDCFGRFGLCT